MQAVMAGRIDTAGGTPEPLLQAFAQDNDLVMIFNFIRRPTGSIAVLDASPIRALTDFKGKKARMTLLVTPDQTAHGWGSYNPKDVETWNRFAVAGGILTKELTDLG